MFYFLHNLKNVNLCIHKKRSFPLQQCRRNCFFVGFFFTGIWCQRGKYTLPNLNVLPWGDTVIFTLLHFNCCKYAAFWYFCVQDFESQPQPASPHSLSSLNEMKFNYSHSWQDYGIAQEIRGFFVSRKLDALCRLPKLIWRNVAVFRGLTCSPSNRNQWMQVSTILSSAIPFFVYFLDQI